MKILILAAVRCSLIFTAVTASLFSVRPAEAYTVTLQQMGANVVANGSGAINLTGLTFFLPGIDFTARIWAGGGVIITGPPGGSGDVDLYTGFTGPTSFGSGFFFFPNTGSGDIVGIDAQGFGGLLAVPPGYLSGAALSDSKTFNNATFASLGMTPSIFQGAAYLYRFIAETPIGKESPESRDRSRGLDGVVEALAGAIDSRQ